MFITVSLVGGSLIGYATNASTTYASISNLNELVSSLKTQLTALQSAQGTDTQTVVATVEGQTISLAQLYEDVQNSVVLIEGYVTSYTMPFGQKAYSQIQGSGFVYEYEGQTVIITNNHVVEGASDITVTFINGNTYPATVLGTDGYADLAVLSTEAPQSEYYPLEIVSSSTLNVGDPLLAIGGPYGLAGTMTTGIVSALNRTITEDMSGSYPIADVIQTSAPINSGNSGGPLLNYFGQVVGITTAIVSNSEGLGFAIPSDTILREIGSLITEGSYNKHSTIGASGTDMTYGIAQEMGTEVTYGWLVTQVTSGGAADQAGLRAGAQRTNIDGTSIVTGGDIIIAINGYRIRNIDDLSTYLERNTLPGQVITITIVRDNQTLNLSLTLGARSTQT
jgi:S1-C subfamily serine protease